MASTFDFRRFAPRLLDLLVTVLAALAVISLALEYGFPDPLRPLSLNALHNVQWAAVAVFVLGQIVRIAAAQRRVEALKADAVNIVIIVLGGALLIIQYEIAHGALLKAGAIYVTTMQGLILARAGLGIVQFNVALSRSRIHPARLVVLSFVAVIVVGALLLALPNATRGPGVYTDTPAQLARHLLKCLFTATSATCVTGLIVYDTGRDFTLFGQIVILVLIQLGGLGIMISSTILGLLVGRQLSLRESLVLQDSLAHQTIGRIARTVKYVCLATFILEAAGALLLYSMWPATLDSFGQRIFYSVFHSVSAFCNAGFTLPSDNLIAFRGAWQVYGVIMPLIVLGGLGFPVLENLTHVLRARCARGFRVARDTLAGRIVSRRSRQPGLTLHSKLVLTATVVLIIVPAGLIWLAETPTRLNAAYPVSAIRPHDQPPRSVEWMSGMGSGERALSALFQSITTRTAGFNTVQTTEAALSPATHFLMCTLMIIGGSPGSTAGGMKTVTLMVLVLAVVATMRRRPRVEAFSRSIDLTSVRRAATIVILMGTAVAAFTVVLSYTESGTLRETLFEVISATGTVGLSAGLTPRLTDFGQAIIILAMFVGRLGPLTLLVALAGQERGARYEYPQEPVLIG